MSDEIFSNADSIQTISSKAEREKLQEIKRDLGIDTDADMIILCAAIGLYRSALKGEGKATPPAFTKLTNISIFKDSKLYDRIIRSMCKIEKPILKDFNEYVYTGFKIVKDWFDSHELTQYKLDSWSDFITKMLASDDTLQDKFKPKQS